MKKSICAAAFLTALLSIVALSHSLAQQPPQPGTAQKQPPPGATGNADNVKYLEQKKDPKGNPIRLAKQSGHVSNYSEDKVPPYKLPELLVTSGGERVTTAEMWVKKRRPEILKQYQEEIYGRIPDNAPKVTWEVKETDPKARNGKAIMKRLVGKIGNKQNAPTMNVTMFLPADANGPVPLLLNITFGGGASGGRGGAGGAGQGDSTTGLALDRGWGYATLGYSDIQPDQANQWTRGVIGQTLKEGQTKPAPNEWGTIAAWAWGISRCIDYFETDKAVNAKLVSITGTSRLGKTVLWAGASDERVAAVCSIVSGEMGAALIRRDWGETLDDMAQNYGYQFAGNLQKYVGKWNDLPIDQHMLIALCAPRPVYVNGGLTDQWSDPKGEFLAMVAAGPAYTLLGKKDLGVTDLPPLDKPITTGSLAFHYHSGGHQAVPADWRAFFEFADRHFKETPGK